MDAHFDIYGFFQLHMPASRNRLRAHKYLYSVARSGKALLLDLLLNMSISSRRSRGTVLRTYALYAAYAWAPVEMGVSLNVDTCSLYLSRRL